MSTGQREVSRTPSPEQPPASFLLFELAFDDGLSVRRQEAHRPLGVVTKEAPPRGLRGGHTASVGARRIHLKHVEESRRSEFVY